jgi:orotidine-5'-phosphate decarboxylase
MNFYDRLHDASIRNKSLLCVGLDPWIPSMPINDITSFNRAIIEATADLVCAYKPNFAFYESYGIDGLRALDLTMKSIPTGIPVILDVKRSDIGNTAVAYAKAAFDVWGADAVTINPYLGQDSIEPFTSYTDRGIFVLIRTSNPGANDFQSIEVDYDGRKIPLYQRIGIQSLKWNHNKNIGFVIGATAPEELKLSRELFPDIPFLIPGIGVQGGDLTTSITDGTDAHGRNAIISVSRQVLYASKDKDFPKAARSAADTIRLEINKLLEIIEQPW